MWGKPRPWHGASSGVLYGECITPTGFSSIIEFLSKYPPWLIFFQTYCKFFSAILLLKIFIHPASNMSPQTPYMPGAPGVGLTEKRNLSFHSVGRYPDPCREISSNLCQWLYV